MKRASTDVRTTSRGGLILDRRTLMWRAAALSGSMMVVSAASIGRATGSAATAAIARQQTPTAGGTLREGGDLAFSGLDPISAFLSEPPMSALYEPLLAVNADGDLESRLAERWDLDIDARRLTLTIRENARFHSGRPVDAASITENLEALRNAASGSPSSSSLTLIDRIETPDTQTVVLTLKRASYDVLNVLSTGATAIMNIATRTEFGEDYGRQIVDGSGPFTFEEWVPGSHVSARRWEAYPGSIVPSVQNKGRAHLDRVRWETIPDPAQRAARLERGEIDALPGPAPGDVARLQENPDLNVVTFSEPSGYLLGLNFERIDLDFHDITMRRAISGSVDRAAIVDTLLFGQGEPLQGPVSSADRTFTAEVERFNRFDLEAAKRAVTELGWAVGADGIRQKGGRRLSFCLAVVDDPFLRDLSTALGRQLRELGIEVLVDPVDLGTFPDRVNGGVDSYLHYYHSPVPTDAVIPLVGSGLVRNWARAKVPPVDVAISDWQQAATRDDLKQAGQRFALTVAEHLPVIPLISRNAVWVHRTNVHGWAPDRYAMFPNYADVWLD